MLCFASYFVITFNKGFGIIMNCVMTTELQQKCFLVEKRLAMHMLAKKVLYLF